MYSEICNFHRMSKQRESIMQTKVYPRYRTDDAIVPCPTLRLTVLWTCTASFIAQHHLTISTQPTASSFLDTTSALCRLYDPSITFEDTSMIFSVTTLVAAICMPLVGLLQFRLGLRSCAAIGAIILGCSTMACSRATTFGGITVLNAISGLGAAFA